MLIIRDFGRIILTAILGAVLPLSQSLPFLTTYGFDMPLFFRQLFQNHVSAFFGVDVIVSSLALSAFVFSEGPRRGMKNIWLHGEASGLSIHSRIPLRHVNTFRQ